MRSNGLSTSQATGMSCWYAEPMGRRAEVKMKFGPNDEWTAEMTWDDDDRSGPSLMVIRPTDPKVRPVNGISQTVLREVDIAGAITLARGAAKVISDSGRSSINWESEYGPALRALAENGVTDPYLAALSLAYSAAASRPKPLDQLAAVVGKSPSAIKNHLWHATRKGYLERSPGRVGGAVTLAALGVLGEHEVNMGGLGTSAEVVDQTPEKSKRRRPQKATTTRSET